MIAGIVALVALAGVLASLGWLHLEPTRLSPIRDPVSQYGITVYRVGYRIATLTFAAAGLALAVGTAHRLGSRASTVTVLLVVFAAARLAISWFPMDAPREPRTGTGLVHWLLAIAAFGTATSAALKLAGLLARGSRWHQLAPVSRGLGWAMLACLMAMACARWLPALRERFGAIERGFYLAAIAWFAVFAIACTARLH